MKMMKVLLGSLVLLGIALPLAAETGEADAVLGERLVRDIFANPGAARLAKGFQSVHQDGARDLDAEKKTLDSMIVRDYTLSNFRVTREADVLVVTYAFAGREVIDGKQASARPAPRMSVFIKSGEQWQWLAHANLIPIATSK